MVTPQLSVLLVEDSPIMGGLLSRLVEQEEALHLAGAVTSPDAAIGAIESLHPDVTVLDLMLDGGSGFDVLRALNELPGVRPNVVVLTNLAGDRYREEAMRLGASQFFDKSSEIPAMLKALIGLAYERRRRGRIPLAGYQQSSPGRSS